MADAKHTPADDASFRASVLKQGGGAVAVVAASALVFWGIGALGGGPTVPSVSDGDVAAPDDAGPDDEVEPAPDGPDADEADDPPADEADEDATDDPGDAPNDEPGDAADDDADDAADAEGSGDDDAPQDEPSDDPDADAVDPASVSIQVLDGLKSDGGAAADAVAAELADGGYRVIARNQALDYEVTTVLFNAGNEAAARRIARDLGGADVREQPGNLSTQVDVHVVVGADRG